MILYEIIYIVEQTGRWPWRITPCRRQPLTPQLGFQTKKAPQHNATAQLLTETYKRSIRLSSLLDLLLNRVPINRVTLISATEIAMNLRLFSLATYTKEKIARSESLTARIGAGVTTQR